jgi:DNA polymerase
VNSADVLTAAVNASEPSRSILFDRAKVLDLQERIKSCTSCTLSSDTTPVPWEGHSDIAIIGEAPGADEARQGRPFVGSSGQLLVELLGQAGYSRSELAYINTVCCRPPRNDFSKAEEAGAVYRCAPNFWEQISLSGAWFLVPMGNHAMWNLLPTVATGISQVRGQVRWVDQFLVLPTFHPAYALRNPKARASILEDLLMVKRIRDGIELAPVPQNYDPTRLLSTMREDDYTLTESKPLKATFKKKGWIFAYSRWLEDTVILKRDDKVKVPDHVEGVVYTVQELVQLSAMKSRTWEDARRLHYAKRELGAKLV